MYWPDALNDSIPDNPLIHFIILNDLTSAAIFQHHFPAWAVRCVLVLPRQQPELAARPTQTLTLMHPVTGVPGVAEVVGAWQKNGRLLGLVLQFPDGYRTGLTFAEIQSLQEDRDHIAAPLPPDCHCRFKTDMNT